MENHENHENLRNLFQNYENHENHRNLCDNYENHKNQRNPLRIMNIMKISAVHAGIMKINKITKNKLEYY